MDSDEEDIALVQDFKNGNEKAFDRLFEKYQVPLYSICYRYARNEDDARELTQDVFLKVYNNLRKFEGKSKFFTWLYRIAVNSCISFKRKPQLQFQTVEVDARTGSMGMDEKVRMKIAIDDALAKLPDRQRMSFILHHYQGYTFDEVAGIMGITGGAAKANHHHAVRKLREYLKDWL